MIASLLRIVVMLLASVAAAAGWTSYKGLPWFEDMQAVRARAERMKELKRSLAIGLGEVRARIEQGAIVIDARAPRQYREAHLDVVALGGAIPALNVPPEYLFQNLDRLGGLQGNVFLLYCNSPTCELAEELALGLIENGFSAEDIRIYPDGWEGFEKAKLPTTSGADDWFPQARVPEAGSPPGDEALIDEMAEPAQAPQDATEPMEQPAENSQTEP